MPLSKLAKEIQRVKAVPVLHYDSSKSAIMRIFSSIAPVAIHYVRVPVSMSKFVCPSSIDPSAKCLYCENNGKSGEPRYVLCGWDCLRNVWCYSMMCHDTIRLIKNDVVQTGISADALMAGEGPDFIFQRVGFETLVMMDSTTLGDHRGPRPPIRKGEESAPTLDRVLKQLQNASFWKKFKNAEEVILDCDSRKKQEWIGSDIEARPIILNEKISTPATRTELGEDRWDFI